MTSSHENENIKKVDKVVVDENNNDSGGLQNERVSCENEFVVLESSSSEYRILENSEILVTETISSGNSEKTTIGSSAGERCLSNVTTVIENESVIFEKTEKLKTESDDFLENLDKCFNESTILENSENFKKESTPENETTISGNSDNLRTEIRQCENFSEEQLQPNFQNATLLNRESYSTNSFYENNKQNSTLKRPSVSLNDLSQNENKYEHVSRGRCRHDRKNFENRSKVNFEKFTSKSELDDTSPINSISYTLLNDETLYKDADTAQWNGEFPEREIHDFRLPKIGSSQNRNSYHKKCLIPNENFHLIPSIGSTSPLSNINSHRKEISKILEIPKPKIKKREINLGEKPTFVTTVKSGIFLDPPPEKAALLGLVKDEISFARKLIYSYRSKPSVVHCTQPKSPLEIRRKRSVKNVSNKSINSLVESDQSSSNGTYTKQVIHKANTTRETFVLPKWNPHFTNAKLLDTEIALTKTAEARRRAEIRRRAQQRVRKIRDGGTPPPLYGKKHNQIQTDDYWDSQSPSAQYQVHSDGCVFQEPSKMHAQTQTEFKKMSNMGSQAVETTNSLDGEVILKVIREYIRSSSTISANQKNKWLEDEGFQHDSVSKFIEMIFSPENMSRFITQIFEGGHSEGSNIPKEIVKFEEAKQLNLISSNSLARKISQEVSEELLRSRRTLVIENQTNNEALEEKLELSENLSTTNRKESCNNEISNADLTDLNKDENDSNRTNIKMANSSDSSIKTKDEIDCGINDCNSSNTSGSLTGTENGGAYLSLITNDVWNKTNSQERDLLGNSLTDIFPNGVSDNLITNNIENDKAIEVTSVKMDDSLNDKCNTVINETNSASLLDENESELNICEVHQIGDTNSLEIMSHENIETNIKCDISPSYQLIDDLKCKKLVRSMTNQEIKTSLLRKTHSCNNFSDNILIDSIINFLDNQNENCVNGTNNLNGVNNVDESTSSKSKTTDENYNTELHTMKSLDDSNILLHTDSDTGVHGTQMDINNSGFQPKEVNRHTKNIIRSLTNVENIKNPHKLLMGLHSFDDSLLLSLKNESNFEIKDSNLISLENMESHKFLSSMMIEQEKLFNSQWHFTDCMDSKSTHNNQYSSQSNYDKISVKPINNTYDDNVDEGNKEFLQKEENKKSCTKNRPSVLDSRNTNEYNSPDINKFGNETFSNRQKRSSEMGFSEGNNEYLAETSSQMSNYLNNESYQDKLSQIEKSPSTQSSTSVDTVVSAYQNFKPENVKVTDFSDSIDQYLSSNEDENIYTHNLESDEETDYSTTLDEFNILSPISEVDENGRSSVENENSSYLFKKNTEEHKYLTGDAQNLITENEENKLAKSHLKQDDVLSVIDMTLTQTHTTPHHNNLINEANVLFAENEKYKQITENQVLENKGLDLTQPDILSVIDMRITQYHVPPNKFNFSENVETLQSDKTIKSCTENKIQMNSAISNEEMLSIIDMKTSQYYDFKRIINYNEADITEIDENQLVKPPSDQEGTLTTIDLRPSSKFTNKTNQLEILKNLSLERTVKPSSLETQEKDMEKLSMQKQKENMLSVIDMGDNQSYTMLNKNISLDDLKNSSSGNIKEFISESSLTEVPSKSMNEISTIHQEQETSDSTLTRENIMLVIDMENVHSTNVPGIIWTTDEVIPGSSDNDHGLLSANVETDLKSSSHSLKEVMSVIDMYSNDINNQQKTFLPGKYSNNHIIIDIKNINPLDFKSKTAISNDEEDNETQNLTQGKLVSNTDTSKMQGSLLRNSVIYPYNEYDLSEVKEMIQNEGNTKKINLTREELMSIIDMPQYTSRSSTSGSHYGNNFSEDIPSNNRKRKENMGRINLTNNEVLSLLDKRNISLNSQVGCLFKQKRDDFSRETEKITSEDIKKNEILRNLRMEQIMSTIDMRRDPSPSSVNVSHYVPESLKEDNISIGNQEIFNSQNLTTEEVMSILDIRRDHSQNSSNQSCYGDNPPEVEEIAAKRKEKIEYQNLTREEIMSIIDMRRNPSNPSQCGDYPSKAENIAAEKKENRDKRNITREEIMSIIDTYQSGGRIEKIRRSEEIRKRSNETNYDMGDNEDISSYIRYEDNKNNTFVVDEQVTMHSPNFSNTVEVEVTINISNQRSSSNITILEEDEA